MANKNIINKKIKIKNKGVEVIIDTNLDGHFCQKVFTDGKLLHHGNWYQTMKELDEYYAKVSKKTNNVKLTRIMEGLDE